MQNSKTCSGSEFYTAFLVTIMLSNAAVNIAAACGSCCLRKPLMEINLNRNWLS